jgi:hypothetical protein
VSDSRGTRSHAEDSTLGFYAPYQDSELSGGSSAWHKKQNEDTDMPNPATHGTHDEQDPLRNRDRHPSGIERLQPQQQKSIAQEQGAESSAQPWTSVPDPAVPTVDQVLFGPGSKHSKATGSGVGEVSVALPFVNSITTMNQDHILDTVTDSACIETSMDALTELALAENIIQFVNFGSQLLSQAEGLYKSSAGSLTVNEELELFTMDLRALITKLRKSLSPAELNSSPGPAGQADYESWTSFQKICLKAANIADEILEILGRLGKLKVKDSKHRKWQSLKYAVKSLWSEKEISSLVKRLSALEKALEPRLVFLIR